MRKHLSYANVVATLALVVAVSGGSAAMAISLNKGSVGTKQLKNGSVTAAKLAPTTTREATNLGGLADVSCAPGERLLGGGGASQDVNDLGVSAPLPEGANRNRWVAGNGIGQVKAYAICLKKK